MILKYQIIIGNDGIPDIVGGVTPPTFTAVEVSQRKTINAKIKALSGLTNVIGTGNHNYGLPFGGFGAGTVGALAQTITVTTTAGTSSYALTGAGQKFRINDAINTTSLIGLRNIEFVDMNRKLNLGAPSQSIPSEFCFSGVDGSGDTKVDLFPVPNGAFTLLFDLTIPQAALTADGTSVKVLDYLVTQNAYARALMERGEDGGLSSSEAYTLFRSMLSDYIALEANRYPENQQFVST